MPGGAVITGRITPGVPGEPPVRTGTTPVTSPLKTLVVMGKPGQGPGGLIVVPVVPPVSPMTYREISNESRVEILQFPLTSAATLCSLVVRTPSPRASLTTQDASNEVIAFSAVDRKSTRLNSSHVSE